MRGGRALIAAALLLCSGWGRADPIKVMVGNLDRTVYAKSYALLIGQVNYDAAVGWDKVPGAPERVRKIAAALQRQGFDAANIQTLSDLDGPGLLGAIKTFIAQHADPEARIFIFYNGHGASLGQGTENERGFLVPINAPSEGDAAFVSKAVGLDEVKKVIASSRAKHTLVIFDSCFSGLVFDTLGNSKQRQLSASSWASFKKPRVQIITAGDADQKVHQDDEFVDAVVKGLDGAAVYRHSNVITADDLATFLRHTVQETTPRSGSAGLESGGEFMFASRSDVRSQPTQGRPLGSAERVEPTVRYYKKSLDGLTVLRSLDKSGFSYEARHPEIGDIFVTNSLGCGMNTDIGTMKAIAKGLVRDGVPLRMIYRFRQGDPKRRTIDLVTFRVSDTVPLETPVLTEQQIDSLQTCPTFFWIGQRSPEEWPIRNPPRS